MKRNICERIDRYNRNRSPAMVELKYRALRTDAFAFLRGTCHLFYEDWPPASPLNHAPLTWVCGDLHLENFGSYKGDNRLVYFDLNDFDEGLLAPCTWEITRLVTSILVGARVLEIHRADALGLARYYLNVYAASLLRGKAQMVETETAAGMVRELLDSLTERKRIEFLDRRTQMKNGRRQFILDGQRLAPVTAEERRIVRAFMARWAATQPDPGFFKLLDVAHRIAGVGSLGVNRYALLVAGKSSPDRNYLLDLKEARPSALRPYLKGRLPKWDTEAERVVAVQDRMQGVCPALLSPVVMNGRAYVLRELQPIQDRVHLKNAQGKRRRLDAVIKSMAELTASSQLRSGGRQGSATTDELIAFAQEKGWRQAVLDYAVRYARQVEADQREFAKAKPKPKPAQSPGAN